ncbi:glycoside hydrolase family 97 protein [Parapedobacter tibetensis]|uniref:glycoside hydrolase family 97 protein n=1 Tax=Parapedobacter tibetensis TaxID=2972951 RepID=UPI00214DD937|nr:glycoside hydrolase family 97 protein [Parapedobacter tibetensis]
MNILTLISIISCLSLSNVVSVAQQPVRLKSPNGNIDFTFHVSGRTLAYSVSFMGEPLVESSELALDFQKGGEFGSDVTLLTPIYREDTEIYKLIVGKASQVEHPYQEVLIPLQERKGAKRLVNIRVRIFDDGLAFRYEFPQQPNWSAYTLVDEHSMFNVAGDPLVTALFSGHYNTSHEGRYHKMPLKEVAIDTLIDIPALFEFSENRYMAITEAGLRDYAGMYLVRKAGATLVSQLSPLQGQQMVKVNATLPHHTPWRVLMIGDEIGKLLESHILTSLNEPPADMDWSWVKPGKTSFHWWNGDQVPDTTFAPGVNFETNKYYIDFCARNGIEYHSVIGYGGVSWYYNDGFSYADSGPNADVTKPLPSLEIEKICNYAAQKGVGIHVWVHWEALYQNIDAALSQFERWGIRGMMVDFLNRDDQQMVNIQEEILRKSAKHKLYVQFHGSFKPTGLHRTYPNEFTREGTFNYEHNKWGKDPISPDHDLDIVFTRLLAGASDYHLGGFKAVTEAEYRPLYTKPMMIGTRCHMLAMYVVLESYLQMVADAPSHYEGQPGFEFLQQVPTVWDETRVPAAQMGQYAVVARRKGDVWYIGAINGSQQRIIGVPLSFLSSGQYRAVRYKDAPDSVQHPNQLVKEESIVESDDIIQMNLIGGGGEVLQLEPIVSVELND